LSLTPQVNFGSLSGYWEQQRVPLASFDERALQHQVKPEDGIVVTKPDSHSVRTRGINFSWEASEFLDVQNQAGDFVRDTALAARLIDTVVVERASH